MVLVSHCPLYQINLGDICSVSLEFGGIIQNIQNKNSNIYFKIIFNQNNETYLKTNRFFCVYKVSFLDIHHHPLIFLWTVQHDFLRKQVNFYRQKLVHWFALPYLSILITAHMGNHTTPFQTVTWKPTTPANKKQLHSNTYC